MHGINRSAGLVAVMVASVMTLGSCGASGQSNTSSLNLKIAQIETTESKWKGPDAKIAADAINLAFPKELGEAVEKALKRDLPGAVLGLREIVQKSNGGPNQKQKEWLEFQISLLTPDALKVLSDAFNNAKSVLDIRGILIAQTVANKIKKDAQPNAQEEVSGVLQRLLTGAAARYYWNVTNVTGLAIGDTYSERTGMGTASVGAQNGQHLLRVRATVKNVSSGTDQPYVLDVFSGIQRDLASNMAEVTSKDTLSGPHRWLDQELVFLVDAAGKMISCGLPPQGSALRGGMELGVGNRLILIPRAIKASEELDNLECIFPVPNQEQQYKLLVLGAAPAPLRLTSSK